MFYHQNSAVLTLLSCVVICLHLVVNVSKEKIGKNFTTKWLSEFMRPLDLNRRC